MGSDRRQPVLGAVTGLVLGFVGGSLVLMAVSEQPRLDNQLWQVLLSVTAGCALIGGLLGIYANISIAGRCKYLTVGFLAGIIIGLLTGVIATEVTFDYAITASGLRRADPFFGKMTGSAHGSFRVFGLWFGPITGGLVGVTWGFCLSLKQNRVTTAIILVSAVVLTAGVIWSVAMQQLQERIPKKTLSVAVDRSGQQSNIFFV